MNLEFMSSKVIYVWKNYQNNLDINNVIFLSIASQI